MFPKYYLFYPFEEGYLIMIFAPLLFKLM